jgi:hypothetical protein
MTAEQGQFSPFPERVPHGGSRPQHIGTRRTQQDLLFLDPSTPLWAMDEVFNIGEQQARTMHAAVQVPCETLLRRSSTVALETCSTCVKLYRSYDLILGHGEQILRGK